MAWHVGLCFNQHEGQLEYLRGTFPSILLDLWSTAKSIQTAIPGMSDGFWRQAHGDGR